MASIRQVEVLAAGGQPWNVNTCSTAGNRFLYASTLAIYIYEYHDKFQMYKLHSVMCEHQKTITNVSFKPGNPNLIASVSSEGKIIIWDVESQKVVASNFYTEEPIICLQWYLKEDHSVSFVTECGPIMVWNYFSGETVFRSLKQTNAFTSLICTFKWNTRDPQSVCFGHENGSISVILSGKKIKKNMFSNFSDDKIQNTSRNGMNHVVSMEWDLLSTDYLLYATKMFGVRLVDVRSETVITEFLPPKVEAKIQMYRWIQSAPGMFISADTDSGLLRLWSVANTKNLVNIKVKDTGFHSICVMNDIKCSEDKNSSHHQSSSYSTEYTIPPSKIVCVFKDGGIGVYDLRRKKWDFQREKGHIETIFNCKFHPDNPDILATGSFDGSIKTWNITNMKMVKESPGNCGIVYCLSWSPGDLNCICAATSKNGIIIWDVSSNQISHTFKEHGANSVFTCAWNQQNSTSIASGGADNQCIIRRVDGTLVKKFRHPGSVYGCDWNPKSRDILATGCEDSLVRVFYVASQNGKPMKTFEGHTAKVFQVRWSPLRDGILCSGSDDKTIRIWDYTEDGCLVCLEGHTQPVRGLLWNTGIPNILISGSWDNSIKVWDIQKGYCICETSDHSADVYGLTCHPQRPFIFASSSRDSTLRIWCLYNFMQPVFLSLLSGGQEGEDDYENENLQKLSGQFSAMLKLNKNDSNGKNVSKIDYRPYSRLLLPPSGVDNLWLLCRIVSEKKKKPILPENYSDGIMHVSHITMFYSSHAVTLETVRSSFHCTVGSKKRKEKILEAADVYVKIGELEKYCEIMVELNEWERALSLAPGVSYEYWQSLSVRYAQILQKEENHDSVLYYLASKEIAKLYEMYNANNEFMDAISTVQMAKEKDIHLGRYLNWENSGSEYDYSKLLKSAVNSLVEVYVQKGQPVLAACCCLANDDFNGAACVLLRCNELELSYCLTKYLKIHQNIEIEICRLLAMRCERLRQWDLGISFIRNCRLDALAFCARFTGTQAEKEELLHKAGLPSIKECLKMSSNQACSETEKLLYLLCSKSHENIISSVMGSLKKIISRETWTIDQCVPYIDILSSVKLESIQGLSKKIREEMLAICAYIGALRAVRMKYNTIVNQLFMHACFNRNLFSSFLKQDNINIGIHLNTVTAEHEAWMCYNEEKDLKMADMSRKDFKKLWKKCGQPPIGQLCGDVIVTSQNLPSHSESFVSMFDGKKITGPAFMLEDNKSFIPYNMALMWAYVNPFSPLATGCRINPF